MSIVRLLTKSEAPLIAKSFYTQEKAGPLTSSLAHAPTLLKESMPFISRALGPSAIDFRTKEIVILRTSIHLSCFYCVNTHTVIASKCLNKEELVIFQI